MGPYNRYGCLNDSRTERVRPNNRPDIRPDNSDVEEKDDGSNGKFRDQEFNFNDQNIYIDDGNNVPDEPTIPPIPSNPVLRPSRRQIENDLLNININNMNQIPVINRNMNRLSNRSDSQIVQQF